MKERDEMIGKDRQKKTDVTRRTFLKQTAKAAMALTVAGSLPIVQSVTAVASSDRDYDILIKGGTIYDGTLNPPRVADIGIKGGRIVAINDLAAAAGKIIDARGLAVTPGFIDIHTHCDLTFQAMGSLRYFSFVMPSLRGNYNYLYQGVTTVVTGNCGYGYTDTDRWLNMVKSLSFGTNVLHLVPHGAVRKELFGAIQPGELTAAQLDALKRRIAEEMEKGAIGVSTGLEYVPGLLATTSELIEIARVTARFGGLYTTHVRDESGKMHEDGKPGIISSLEEAVEVCKKARIPVEISHLKIAAPTNHVPASQILDIIEKARHEGLDLHADHYPYNASSQYITQLIPHKFKTSDGIKDEFKTEKGRQEIREAVEMTFAYLPPEKTLISWYPAMAEFEGKTLKEIAEIRGKSPSECYAEMVSEKKCPTGIFFSMDMATVKEIMPRDYIITALDGWTVPKDMMKPHPRVYGTFPRKLRQSTIDAKMMTLPAAIRSMTSLPAEKFRIKNRGKIEKGFQADLAVIDLGTITDRATYPQPHQYALGVRHLFVNGVAAITDGQATGNSGGMALRR